MKRAIDAELLKWKKNKNRKILLIRGARQVGKTYSIRALGKKFDYFLEVNFEEDPKLAYFFSGSLNPFEICEKLSIFSGVDIIPRKTLLFFDEIQACPNALKALRFFYEKMPDLHVVAAGSLLEFVISEIPSFGVGRIGSLFMYPMTFSEYLIAAGHEKLVKLIMSSSLSHPVDPIIHEKILEKLKIFQIIGGMPEVVKTYLKDSNFKSCQMVIDNLLTSLVDDFAKYKKRSPVVHLQEVFTSIVHQAGKKFKYSNIASSGSQRSFKNALELLIKAGLAYKVYHTSARGIPLAAQTNHSKFKVIVFDSGIYQRTLGLDLAKQMVSDFSTIINRGYLSEIFAGLELIAGLSPYARPELYYWHREARSSNAEIDYVISRNTEIIPMEVKAGTKGQMQSLYLFLKERNLAEGLRISHENFAKYGKIQTIPLYAVSNILR